MAGSLEPGSPVPDAFLKTAVEWAVMHEVGHALGLRHNFRSSTSTPYDELQDPAFTTTHGLYSSVMEYPSPNIDAGRRRTNIEFVADTDDFSGHYALSSEIL